MKYANGEKLFKCNTTDLVHACMHNDLWWTGTIKNALGKARDFTHKQALDYAKLIGARLPTIDELLKAYISGLEFEPERFWSGSVHPNDSTYAYNFDGYNGNVSVNYRSNSYAVRCVFDKE